MREKWRWGHRERGKEDEIKGHMDYNPLFSHDSSETGSLTTWETLVYGKSLCFFLPFDPYEVDTDVYGEQPLLLGQAHL